MIPQLIQKGLEPNLQTKTYMCDTEADVSQLSATEAGFGSKLYVIAGGALYIANSIGEWVKQ